MWMEVKETNSVGELPRKLGWLVKAEIHFNDTLRAEHETERVSEASRIVIEGMFLPYLQITSV
jgi:hypothetical protein